jgi:hypothetical protein
MAEEELTPLSDVLGRNNVADIMEQVAEDRDKIKQLIVIYTTGDDEICEYACGVDVDDAIAMLERVKFDVLSGKWD